MQKINKTKNATNIPSIENLLDKKIVAADGKTLGHVIDIQLARDSRYRVVALMYGYHSLLYRLHVYEPVARAFHLHEKPKKIAWEAVERVDHEAIWLKVEK
jgi:sporulation protein YlmC with PRC-barrel domain